MIDFFSRLDNYLKYKGLNDNKLTVETGISNGLIGKARKRGSLSQDNISKILCKYSELDANWLLTGIGYMLKSDITPIAIVQDEDSNKMVLLERDNERLKETNDLLRFKVSALEKQITEFRYNSTKEPVLYRTVAESAPELIKKKSK